MHSTVQLRFANIVETSQHPIERVGLEILGLVKNIMFITSFVHRRSLLL